jgi:hypothetical protein
MNQALITSLIISLLLTILLETGFFLITGKRRQKDLRLVVLVNVITNPIVVLSYWLAVRYTNWHPAAVLIPLELLAILVEGNYYKKYGQDFRKPYLFAITANIFSFGLGVIIQQLI